MRSYPFYEKLIMMLKKPEYINYVMELASNEKDKSIVLKLSKKLPNPSYKYSYPKIEDYIPDKYKNKYGIWLIGYDGKEKSYSNDTSLLKDIHNIIDTMPIRKREITQQIKKCN